MPSSATSCPGVKYLTRSPVAAVAAVAAFLVARPGRQPVRVVPYDEQGPARPDGVRRNPVRPLPGHFRGVQELRGDEVKLHVWSPRFQVPLQPGDAGARL